MGETPRRLLPLILSAKREPRRMNAPVEGRPGAVSSIRRATTTSGAIRLGQDLSTEAPGP
jgi:hypothetical protein